MSAVLRAGPAFGGFSLGAFSPAAPLLGAPPVSVPGEFGVVPILGVGVMLDGVPGPIPGVGAVKVPPPPIPGEGAPPPRCARAVLALPAMRTAAKTIINFMIALACITALL
jgi:hypothetical protein